jgi:heme exporter protein C
VYRVTGSLTSWFLPLAALAIGYGTIAGLVFAPPDYQQGDAFRIIYVHAPSAWMSLMSYTTMAVAGAIGLIWRIKVAHAVARCRSPHRRLFYPPGPGHRLALGPAHVGHLLGLGSPADLGTHPLVPILWGYVPAAGFRGSCPRRPGCGALRIVGVVNVPIIHYSVLWWNSLHQGATVAKLGKPAMDSSMLWPLLSMFARLHVFFGAVLCIRLRGEVLNRERQATWVREALKA